MKAHTQNSPTKCFNCDAQARKSNYLYFAGEDSKGVFLAKAYYCRRHYEAVLNLGLGFKTKAQVKFD